jgi:hypothetical protein
MTDTKIPEFSMDSQIYNQLNLKYEYLSRHRVRPSTQGCTLGTLTLGISNSLHLSISRIFLHKYYSTVTSKHPRPLLLRILRLRCHPQA